jgi:hypothetical protein
MPIVSNLYQEWQCKHCGVLQLVLLGDLEDFTCPDIEAVRCYECHGLELFDEVAYRFSHNLYDEETNGPSTITDSMIENSDYIVEGKPKP